jgi:hypothetical protein
MYWKNKSFNKVAGKISVVIGKPIRGIDAKEITKQTQIWVDKTYKEIS